MSQASARNTLFGLSAGFGVLLFAAIFIVGAFAHFFTAVNMGDEIKFCGVVFSGWHTFVWLISPIAVLLVYLLLRGFVFQGAALPLLIAGLLFAGIVGIDLWFSSVKSLRYEYSQWRSDIHTTSFCTFVRAVLPARQG